MPESSKPSRRRLVVASRPRKPRQQQQRQPLSIDAHEDDHDKTRKNHRIGCRPWSVPLARFPIVRILVTLVTAVAMMGVASGIIAGVFSFLAPPKPKPILVTIERSNYTYTPKDPSIVLGRRPPPIDIGEANVPYSPSALELYIRKHGREMGYDRQIAPPSNPQTPPLGDAAKALSLFAHLRNQRYAGKLTYVDYEDPSNTANMPSGCELWVQEEATNPEIYQQLQTFRDELEDYEFRLDDWTWDPPQPSQGGSWFGNWGWNSGGNEAETETKTTSNNSNDAGKDTPAAKHDLRDYLDESVINNEVVCSSLEIGHGGLGGIFTSSSLSKLPHKQGEPGVFLEPFLPPLRHPEFCYSYYDLQKGRHGQNNQHNNITENDWFSDTGYIIHDFATMCRKNLHKHSKTVFVDVVSPYHYDETSSPLPLIRLYERFGFVFDNIYAYGLHTRHWRKRPETPDDLKSSYHWINARLSSDPKSHFNPFKMISERYTPDDFVVVKLSMNQPDLEIPLAHQLLQEALDMDRTSQEDPSQQPHHKLSDLIDVFYFSHHVAMQELAVAWQDSMRGSMQDSMEFFASLREHGIASHYWI